MSRLSELISDLCPYGVSYCQLDEVLKIKNGKDYKNFNEGNVPVYGSGGVISYIDTSVYDKPSVLIPRKGSVDKLYYVDVPFWNVDTVFYTEIDEEKVLPKYLYYCLQKQHLERLNKAGGVPSLTQGTLNKVVIPIPPLKIQEEIIKLLDNYNNILRELISELTAELSSRQKQYDYYTSYIMSSSSDTKQLCLGDIGTVRMCKRIMKSQTNTERGIPFYKIGTFGKEADAYISEDIFNEYKEKYSYPKKGDILISCAGTIGRTVVFDGNPAYFQDSNIVWLDHDETIVTNMYLQYCYKKEPWKISTGGTIARLYNDNILKAKIYVPPIEEQNRVVSLLEKCDRTFNDIIDKLSKEIEDRQKQYDYYRDQLLSFKQLSE